MDEMKHAIVIGTSDVPHTPIPLKVQWRLEQAVQKILDAEGILSYTQVEFNGESAIALTHEMYHAPKWTGGV